tara:strand:+ start:535 stop:780 length:246 start_codon:yes stop_codon:yes gene_type:complete
MAITKTQKVQRVECYPATHYEEDQEPTYPTLMVVYNEVFDDPKDDDLPITATKVVNLSKDDGKLEEQDDFVKAIANALWSE